jgi:hypothetical protein
LILGHSLSYPIDFRDRLQVPHALARQASRVPLIAQPFSLLGHIGYTHNSICVSAVPFLTRLSTAFLELLV